MRKVINAVLADSPKIDQLRAQNVPWSKIAAYFDGNPAATFTPAQAKAWRDNGFAIWAGDTLLITARLEAFTKLHDLSARVGPYVVENRKQNWIGPYLRGQFQKRERSGKDV